MKKAPEENHSYGSGNKSKSIGQFILLIILFLCFVNIIGYIFNVPVLVSFHVQGTSMRFVTALCFVLAVSSLITLQSAARLKNLFVIGSGLVITLTATLTFANYVFALLTGHESSLSDQPFLSSFLSQESRMAAITAILFILTGAVLIILSGKNHKAPVVAHALAILIFMIGYFIPMSFLVRITSIFSVYNTGVSLITGINFCLLSLAIFLFYPNTWFSKVFHEKSAGGNIARRLVPGIFIGPLVISWLRYNGEKAGLFSSETGIVLIGVAYTFFFLILVWVVAKSANKIDEVRKKFEENLRKSENDYRQLVESANSIIIRLDSKGIFRFVNDYAVKFFGYSKKEEMIGKKVSIILPERETSGRDISNLFNDVVSRPQNYQVFDNENIKKNGELVWISWANRPIFDQSGNLQEILSIGNDFTGQRRLEKEASEKALFIKTITETVPDIISIIEVHTGKLIYRNHEPLGSLGFFELYEMTLNGRKDFLHQDDQDAFQNYCDTVKSARDEDIAYLEFRVRNADNDWNWYRARGKVFERDPAGMVETCFITVQDITREKDAEEAIQKSESILKQAGIIANLGVWEIEFLQWDDINKNPLYWSDQTYRIFGYAPGSVNVTNNLFMDLMHPEDRPKLTDAMAKAIKERCNYRIEHRIRRFDGVERIVLENAEITYNSEGKPLRIIGTVQDITEQKLAEQKLTKAKEKAEESDRLKSAFIANLSHEIRTPMNGILGFADLLNTPNLSEESQKKYIDAISSGGKRMLDIINDLINISKLEAGQMEIKIGVVDINKVLDELFIFFLPEANKKGVMLQFNKELPPDKTLIETDKTKLMQILTNLIKNALKFTSRGYVEFGCKLKGDNYLFYVRDTGIGIKKEFREQIFERFRQGEVAPAEINEGTGLGLAISKAYVELLGGIMSVESEPDRGSIFSFTIPFRESKDVKIVSHIDGKVAGSKSTSDVAETTNCSTVLIADDDDSIYFYLQQLLELNKINTIHARNGLEAVEKIKSIRNIDLVLMDIRMPRMSGLEAARQIRTFNTAVPIIAQSAFNSETDIQNAIEAGCNDYISKPFDSKSLLDKIARHCQP